MTTVVITRNSSPFAGYGQAHLNCRSTTFATTGTLYESDIRWWAFKDGVLVASMFGAPDFGVYVEPGEYTVVCQIRSDEDSSLQEATETWTVSAPTYQAECWLDLDSGTDGVGSLADPFNSPVTASAYIASNHVNGATNQSVVHVKRGTTWSGSTAIFAPGSGLQGRMVVDTYDSGAVPTFTSTLNGALCNFVDDFGCALVDISIYGNYAGGAPGSQTGVQRAMPVNGTYSGGANILLHNVNIQDVNSIGVGAIYTSQVLGFPTTGEVDFLCLDALEISNTGQGAVFGAGHRYVLAADCTFGALADENNFRFSQGGTDFCIRGCDWVDYPSSGGHSHFRLHASGGVVTTRVSVVDCTFDSQDPQFLPSSGGTITNQQRYLKDIWFINCSIDGDATPAAPGGNGLLTWAVVAPSVVRGLRGRTSTANFFSTRGGTGGFTPLGSDDGTNPAIVVSDGHWIEGCSVAQTTASGSTWNFNNATWMTNVRFRNNVQHSTSTSTPRMVRGNSNASTAVFAECDYNYFYSPSAGSLNWAFGWSDVSGGAGATLATWQANTTFDDNSTHTSSGDPLFVDPVNTGTAMDLDIQAGSPLIGAGADLLQLTIDANGHLRSSPFDIGADDYGVSTAPTEPSLGGDVTVTPAPADTGSDTSGPTVILGSLSITPTAADAGSDTSGPTVTVSGGTAEESQIKFSGLHVAAGEALSLTFHGTGSARGRYIFMVRNL